MALGEWHYGTRLEFVLPVCALPPAIFSCRRKRAFDSPKTNMKKKGLIRIVSAAFLAFLLAQMAAGGQPGVTDTTFNRRFIPTIKPMMTYEQIVKLVGTQGIKVGENRNASSPTVQYRWKGSKDSVLTATLSNNRLISATILAPNKHTYLIQSNGEVLDITK